MAVLDSGNRDKFLQAVAAFMVLKGGTALRISTNSFVEKAQQDSVYTFYLLSDNLGF